MSDDWGQVTMGEVQTRNENIPVGTTDAYRSGWDRVFAKRLEEAGVGKIPRKDMRQCPATVWQRYNPYRRCELISGHTGEHQAGSPAFLFWKP